MGIPRVGISTNHHSGISTSLPLYVCLEQYNIGICVFGYPNGGFLSSQVSFPFSRCTLGLCYEAILALVLKEYHPTVVRHQLSIHWVSKWALAFSCGWGSVVMSWCSSRILFFHFFNYGRKEQKNLKVTKWQKRAKIHWKWPKKAKIVEKEKNFRKEPEYLKKSEISIKQPKYFKKLPKCPKREKKFEKE